KVRFAQRAGVFDAHFACDLDETFAALRLELRDVERGGVVEGLTLAAGEVALFFRIGLGFSQCLQCICSRAVESWRNYKGMSGCSVCCLYTSGLPGSADSRACIHPANSA